jgi:lipid A 3-O-deacylase
MFRPLPIVAALPLALVAAPAAAQEVFAGAYVHGVDTPFTFDTGERGPDIELGYRFGRLDALRFIGKPAPYLIASVNTRGDTSFAGAGLSWKIGKGPVYVRPAIGLVVQDGPRLRVSAKGQRTDLGSPVLFEPEIALGAKLSDKVNIEASWVHISHARLFNRHQNPGIDMMGVRLSFALR